MSGTTWRVGAMVGVIAMTGGAFADETPASVAPGMSVPVDKPAAGTPAAEPAPAKPAELAAAAPGSSTAAAPIAPKPAAVKGGAAALKGTVPVAGATPADYPDLARIQLQYAIRAAMTKVQGKLLKVELEPADGFLVWEVEIVKTDKTVFAVKVDAGSGAVLAVERDEPGRDDE